MGQLGQLQLFCDAVEKRSQLPVHLQQQIRAFSGWHIDKAEVLTRNDCIQDTFWVIGQCYEQHKKLLERRVWLWGGQSGKRVLLQDFSYAGLSFDYMWSVGNSYALEIAFYPDGIGLRAIVKNYLTSQAIVALTESHVDKISRALLPVTNPSGSYWQHEKNWQTQLYAKALWLDRSPMVLIQCQIVYARNALSTDNKTGFFAAIENELIELQISEVQKCEILIFSMQRKISLIGEWKSQKFTPLLALCGDEKWQISQAENSTY